MNNLIIIRNYLFFFLQREQLPFPGQWLHSHTDDMLLTDLCIFDGYNPTNNVKTQHMTALGYNNRKYRFNNNGNSRYSLHIKDNQKTKKK